MIINTENSSVEVVGDIQEFKTGIDPKNLEFITTLLSSNLYSAPEKSFIREIVSNAWDSHVEAGNTDTPVLIKINSEDSSITIRDFGTGLSPERFKNIFCNIGSSTKRESNDYIGGFGIGRFSALACSNTVYITSYYKGTMYIYIMCKSGNTITTNLVTTLPTEEKDGVEISIKNVPRIHDYVIALDYIVFFPNVYVELPPTVHSDFNKIKIKKFKYFAVGSKIIRDKILLGNVLYPLDTYQLKTIDRNWLSKIAHTSIVFKFDIGELEVTPNRESIIYTDSTKRIIEDRINKAKKELESIISEKIKGDYTDLTLYFSYISKSLYYDFIEDKCYNNYNDIWRTGAYSFRAVDLDGDITYKGKDLKNHYETIRYVVDSYLPNFKGVITSDRVYTGKANKVPWNYSNGCLLNYDNLILVDSNFRFTSAIKSFLRLKYKNYTVVSKISLDDFKSGILNERGTFIKGLDKIEFFITEMYNRMNSIGIDIDFDKDADFLAHKESLKKEKTDTVKMSDVKLYIYNRTFSGSTCSHKHIYNFSTLNKAIEHLKNIKGGIIINNITEQDHYYSKLALARNFTYVTANKQVVAELLKHPFSNKVELNFLLLHDKVLSKLHSIKASNFTVLSNDILYTIPEPIRGEIEKIQNFLLKYSEYYEYVQYASTINMPIDSYIASISEKSKIYKEQYYKALDAVSDIIMGRNPLFIRLYISKNSLYRMPHYVYKDIHNNKLVRLCRK